MRVLIGYSYGVVFKGGAPLSPSPCGWDRSDARLRGACWGGGEMGEIDGRRWQKSEEGKEFNDEVLELMVSSPLIQLQGREYLLLSCVSVKEKGKNTPQV